jgi:hypothetical protein
MNQLLKFWLCFSLAIIHSPMANATANSDAEASIDSSHHNALTLADQTFVQLLNAVVERVAPYSPAIKQSQQMVFDFGSNLNEAVDNELSRFKGNFNDTLRDEADLQDLLAQDSKSQDQILQGIQSYVNNLRKLTIQSTSLAFNLRSNEQIIDDAKSVVPKIISEVKEICEKGVSVYYVSPNLSRITYTNQQLGIGFSVGASYGQTRGDARPYARLDEDQTHGRALFPVLDSMGKDGVKYDQATSAVLTGVSAGVIQFMWGAAIAKAAGMWAAVIVGLSACVVTIIIAAIVMVVTQGITNDEARISAEQVERVFLERDDAESIRKMVKDECQPFLQKFQDIPRVASILSQSNPDTQVLADFNQRAAAADAIKAKLIEFNDGLVKRQSQLIEAHKSGTNTYTTDMLAADLQSSPEMVALTSYVKQTGTPAIVDQMIVELIRFTKNLSETSRDFSALAKNELESVQSTFKQFQARLPEMIERRNHLFELSREITLQNADPIYAHSINLERNNQIEIAQLYMEWQLAYVDTIKKYLLRGAGAVKEAQLGIVLIRLKAFAKKQKTPNPVIAKLISRTQTVLSSLGKKI